MKKTTIILSLMLASIAVSAQTIEDAFNFSQNTYYGTARTIGMGNAVTAVGGDVGTIGINPAGSAVMGYSQFTISPGFTIGATSSSYSAYPVNGRDVFSNKTGSSITRFDVPNFGIVLNWDTGNRSGLKGVSYGIVVNRTNNFTSKARVGGVNDKTSYLGAMASQAFGYDIDFLNGYRDIDGNELAYRDELYPYYNSNSWNSVTNAQAGAISIFGDPNDPDYYYRYVGATEQFEDACQLDEDGNHILDENGNHFYNYGTGGPLDQYYGQKVTGGKDDIVFNVGFNFSDILYIGANLGITTIDYNFRNYFKEYAENPDDFGIDLTDSDGNPYTINFDNYRTRYTYSMDAAGVYGKFGFILKPITGLRIGAAIQTPTTLHVSEDWKTAVDINYTNADGGYAVSPKGEYDYRLRTPYIFNAGIAYTFAGMALISADYELTDYSSMKFKEDNGNDDDFYGTFDEVNDQIKDMLGVSHTIRVGAEFKPIAELAIRAGYNYSTKPTKSAYGWDAAIGTIDNCLNSYSIGLGYSSPGSFFCDIAGRLTEWKNKYYPYANYSEDCDSPAIKLEHNRWDVVFTFGWRF